MNNQISIERGVFKLDGKPVYVWSADYPYYRDERADWSRQLDNLKKMNVNIVTFYISWRHHAPTDPMTGGGTYDFTGGYNDRTDVLEFIRLIREKGMLCMAKPGPYIHGETRFGSLPDYVMPDLNPRIEMRQDIAGQPVPAPYVFTNKPPAPMDPVYLEYVRQWFNTVGREVILPNEYPNGPIVALQVLNEGVYSRGGIPVDQINFESSGLAHYRLFLQKKYGHISKYNELRRTSFESFDRIPAPTPWTPQNDRKGMLSWMEWGEFCGFFHRTIAETYIGYLREVGVTLPVVMNINTPAEARGHMVENHVGRFNPSYLDDVIHYGYTNWCGVVARNPDSYQKYKLVGKAARGINMEENWGFESYDPPHYWYTQPSFFQSLAYMMWGATGLNIYLGVSCDCWTNELATDPGSLYMSNHPIGHDGSYRASFWTCHQLGALLKHIGGDLIAQRPHAPVAWGLYTPYAQAASWNLTEDDWKKAGFAAKPYAASPGWDSFMALCDKNRTANGVCYPAEDSVGALLKYPMIVMGGGDYMDEETQRKLVDYVEQGGALVLTGQIPELDVRLEPCDVLKKALFPCALVHAVSEKPFPYQLGEGVFSGVGRGALQIVTKPAGLEPMAVAEVEGRETIAGVLARRERGKAVFLGFDPWQPDRLDGSAGLIEYLAKTCAGVELLAPLIPDPDDKRVDVVEYRNDEKRRRQVFVLTRRTEPETYRVAMKEPDGSEESFSVCLPASSGALVGFENGQILSAFIKGCNDIDKSAAAPSLTFGDYVLSADDPCDLYYCRGEDGVCEVSVVNVLNEHGHTLVTLPEPFDNISHIVHLHGNGHETTVKVRDHNGQAAFMANDMRYVKPPYTPVNLAYRADVSASSSAEPIWGPDKTIDGVRGTHWISRPEDNQWLLADLGKAQAVQEIAIGWDQAFAREYETHISVDGEEWTPVYIETFGKPGRKVIRFHEQKKARYVKVICRHRGTEAGFAIYELSVHAHLAGEMPEGGAWSPCYMVHVKA